MILQSLPPRIRYRDAPNCVHGIGCRAKKMISIFGTLSGIYWQTCNNSAHLVEGGGWVCKAIEKRKTLERLKKR